MIGAATPIPEEKDNLMPHVLKTLWTSGQAGSLSAKPRVVLAAPSLANALTWPWAFLLPCPYLGGHPH